MFFSYLSYKKVLFLEDTALFSDVKLNAGSVDHSRLPPRVRGHRTPRPIIAFFECISVVPFRERPLWEARANARLVARSFQRPHFLSVVGFALRWHATKPGILRTCCLWCSTMAATLDTSITCVCASELRNVCHVELLHKEFMVSATRSTPDLTALSEDKP